MEHASILRRGGDGRGAETGKVSVASSQTAKKG
jgi:hypothetical protein